MTWPVIARACLRWLAGGFGVIFFANSNGLDVRLSVVSASSDQGGLVLPIRMSEAVMSFSTYDRVLYQKNPIEEVICQLRFPAILRIDSEVPAAFQERIRTQYPLYKRKTTITQIAGMPPGFAELIAKEMPVSSEVAHEFQSQDENWTLALTREFLAITCQRYDRWENFISRFSPAIAALNETYSPAFLSRVGLRYRDVFRLKDLGLDGCDWHELLEPHISGALSTAIRADIEHDSTDLIVRLGDGRSKVRIRYGLIFAENTEEECFFVDMDLFDDKQTEAENATSRLEFLHTKAHAIFRWCIRDKLHNAMGPHPA